MSPTQLTKKKLKEDGYRPWVVEYFNFYAQKRVDLYNFADIVAIGHGSVKFIQCCAAGSHSARRKKILAEPMALDCVRNGVLVELWSWGKKGKAGKRKLWTVRIEQILESDFSLGSKNSDQSEQGSRTIGTEGWIEQDTEEECSEQGQRQDAL